MAEQGAGMGWVGAKQGRSCARRDQAELLKGLQVRRVESCTTPPHRSTQSPHAYTPPPSVTGGDSFAEPGSKCETARRARTTAASTTRLDGSAEAGRPRAAEAARRASRVTASSGSSATVSAR
eukprot:scaffold10130_cov97-Isochrysis_galbana.AAC.4